MSRLRQLISEVHRRSLWQVLLVYLGAAYAILEATDLFIDRIGLPDWVFQSALVLLVIGFPVVMLTALVQAGGPILTRQDPTLLPGDEGGGPASPLAHLRDLLTWRNALLGGVLAFTLLGIGTAGYMAMHVVGIGPVGSLIAKGVLEERDRIILADFENHTDDPSVALAITEAFRIDLSQSQLVKLAERSYVAGVLGIMQREPDTPLDLALAREVAMRDGLKAVIGGEISRLGTSFVLSAQLISAESGEVLVAYRETARSSEQIIDATDRLSKKIRRRIGESLKEIRRNPPLDQVTTTSLEALYKLAQAWGSGDQSRSRMLIEEAIALDTSFAWAYLRLANSLPRNSPRFVEARTKAFELRDRLTERERYVVESRYYEMIGERDKAIAANRLLLESHPDEPWALNALGNLYEWDRDLARAEEFFRRIIETDSMFSPVPYSNAAQVQFNQAKFEETRETLEKLADKFPEHPFVSDRLAAVASALGDYDGAEEQVRAWLRAGRSFRPGRDSSWWLANLAQVRGRLGDAERYWREKVATNAERDQQADYIKNVVEAAWLDLWFRDAPNRGVDQVEVALDEHPLVSIYPLERPYFELASFFASASQPDLARAFLAEYEAVVEPALRRDREHLLHRALGDVAMAEGRYGDAISEYRLSDVGYCVICALFRLALAYDHAGESDSAIAIYERYLQTPWAFRLEDGDADNLALILERLGQLFEEEGDNEKAIYYYAKLVDLWKDADPELQPRVEAARRAIAALSPDQ